MAAAYLALLADRGVDYLFGKAEITDRTVTRESDQYLLESMSLYQNMWLYGAVTLALIPVVWLLFFVTRWIFTGRWRSKPKVTSPPV